MDNIHGLQLSLISDIMGKSTLFVTSTVTHCYGFPYGCCLPKYTHYFSCDFKHVYISSSISTQSCSTSLSTYFSAGLYLNEEILNSKEVHEYLPILTQNFLRTLDRHSSFQWKKSYREIVNEKCFTACLIKYVTPSYIPSHIPYMHILVLYDA